MASAEARGVAEPVWLSPSTDWARTETHGGCLPLNLQRQSARREYSYRIAAWGGWRLYGGAGAGVEMTNTYLMSKMYSNRSVVKPTSLVARPAGSRGLRSLQGPICFWLLRLRIFPEGSPVHVFVTVRPTSRASQERGPGNRPPFLFLLWLVMRGTVGDRRRWRADARPCPPRKDGEERRCRRLLWPSLDCSFRAHCPLKTRRRLGFAVGL